jgi:hypothetical protein
VCISESSHIVILLNARWYFFCSNLCTGPALEKSANIIIIIIIIIIWVCNYISLKNRLHIYGEFVILNLLFTHKLQLISISASISDLQTRQSICIFKIYPHIKFNNCTYVPQTVSSMIVWVDFTHICIMKISGIISVNSLEGDVTTLIITSRNKKFLSYVCVDLLLFNYFQVHISKCKISLFKVIFILIHIVSILRVTN